MDPLTISTTVLGIAGKCVTVARDLSTLRDKYIHASLTISAICSESAVVNAALCKLQSLFSESQLEAFERFQSRPELAAACDTALTGCTLLYSCLDDEVRSLRTCAGANGEMSWSQKAKTVWKDDTMKELLQQIRGQTSALTLLLQCFHFEHALKTRDLLRNQGEAINQIKSNMSVLRSAYPAKQNMPESVLGDKRSIQAVFADNASIIGDTEFSFDDLVVNSRAYRQAMAAAMSYAKKRATSSSQVDMSDGNSADSVRVLDENTDTQPTNAARLSGSSITPSSSIVAHQRGESPMPTDMMLELIRERQQELERGALSREMSRAEQQELETLLREERSLVGQGRHEAETVEEEEHRATTATDTSTYMDTAIVPQDTLPPRFDPTFMNAMALPSPTETVSILPHSLEWGRLLDFEGLTTADILEVPKSVIEFQNIWWEILTGEQDYICSLQAMKVIFGDQILVRWPKIVQEPQQFVQEVFGGMNDLRMAHTDHLYNPLLEHWMRHGVWTPFDPRPFEKLLHHASQQTLEYCSNFVRAQRRVEMESKHNRNFSDFLQTQRAHPSARRLEWRTFLMSPITRLQGYSLLLQLLLRSNKKRPDGYRMSPRYSRVNVPQVDSQIAQLITRFHELTARCDHLIEDASRQVDQLELCIRLKPREYLTGKPTDLSYWLHPRSTVWNRKVQGWGLFWEFGSAVRWACYELFVVSHRYLVVSKLWNWSSPGLECAKGDETLGALSVEMILEFKRCDIDQEVQPRRKMFGWREVHPPEAGEAYFIIRIPEKREYELYPSKGHGFLFLTGKTSDLTRHVQALYDCWCTSVF